MTLAAEEILILLRARDQATSEIARVEDAMQKLPERVQTDLERWAEAYLQRLGLKPTEPEG